MLMFLYQVDEYFKTDPLKNILLILMIYFKTFELCLVLHYSNQTQKNPQLNPRCEVVHFGRIPIQLH